MPIPLNPVSRIAANAIVARLSDITTGFNPRLLAAMQDAGLTAPRGFALPLDFSSKSFNFFQADVSPGDLSRTTNYTLPLMTLFSVRAENQRLEKFVTFAGQLSFGFNVLFSWMATRALSDMETVGHCFEEALLGTFNDPSIADWSQLFDPRLVYDGDITIQRSPLQIGDENWSQQLQGHLLMDCHAS